ncbi:hypothetical protein ACFXG4_20270 [Nocardia sp. NPDC059246]|uniref:hypothetical protein n=1 Tax=unclassified Nocardia TaxID=2637762 RepID=UPI00367BAA48
MRHNFIATLAATAIAATCTVLATTGTANADPATRLHEGMQVVGQDVAPGTYSTPGPRDQDYGACFITWLPYKGAKDSEATDIQAYSGASYVRLKAGDVITVQGCAWTLE